MQCIIQSQTPPAPAPAPASPSALIDWIELDWIDYDWCSVGAGFKVKHTKAKKHMKPIEVDHIRLFPSTFI
jgi:hypothetical protein